MKKYEPLRLELAVFADCDVLTGSNELPIIPGCFEEENELPLWHGSGF